MPCALASTSAPFVEKGLTSTIEDEIASAATTLLQYRDVGDDAADQQHCRPMDLIDRARLILGEQDRQHPSQSIVPLF